MLSPALKQYVVAGSPLQAMPAQFCGHTGAVGQGPPGGALDMYTQKHTDQVKWVLTTLHTQWFTLTCDHKTRMTRICDHIIIYVALYD